MIAKYALGAIVVALAAWSSWMGAGLSIANAGFGYWTSGLLAAAVCALVTGFTIAGVSGVTATGDKSE